MRNMSLILERWAEWAHSESAGVYYCSIAAGFKGLLSQKSSNTLSCCDEDGLLIDGCIANLKKRRPDEYDMLLSYYYYGVSKRKIAKVKKCDEKSVRIKIQMAEGFVEGCLSMLDVKLEME